MGFRRNDSQDDWKKPEETKDASVRILAYFNGKKIKAFQTEEDKTLGTYLTLVENFGWKTA